MWMIRGGGRAISQIVIRISCGRELNFGKEDGTVAGVSAIVGCSGGMALLLRSIMCIWD
jgi:hypothetical protein